MSKFIIKYNDLGIEPRYLLTGNTFTKDINRAMIFNTKDELIEYAYYNAPAFYEIVELESEK